MAFSGALMGSIALSGAIGAGAATAGAIGLGAGMAGAGAAFSGVAGSSMAAAAPSIMAGSTAMGLGTLGSMAPSLAAPGFMAGMTGTGMAAMSPAMAAYGPMGWDMAAEGAFGSTTPWSPTPGTLQSFLDTHAGEMWADQSVAGPGSPTTTGDYWGSGWGPWENTVESMMPADYGSASDSMFQNFMGEGFRGTEEEFLTDLFKEDFGMGQELGGWDAGADPNAYVAELANQPKGWLDKALDYAKTPIAKNLIGQALSIAGRQTGGTGQSGYPAQQYYPYGEPGDLETLYGGEATEDYLNILREEFGGATDFAREQRESLRTDILPFIFDKDPREDALKNFMPGSFKEFDRLDRAAGIAERTTQDHLYPFMESQRGLMQGLDPMMAGFAYDIGTRSADPYALTPSAATTVGSIEDAARYQLALSMENERKKMQQIAENRFGPDADLNMYLTQMMDPYAKQYSLGQAQLEQGLGQARLKAGIDAYGALLAGAKGVGDMYGGAGDRFLQAAYTLPVTWKPTIDASQKVLGMRRDLLNKGLDIKEAYGQDFSQKLAERFSPMSVATTLGNQRRAEVRPLQIPGYPLPAGQPSLGSDILSSLGGGMAQWGLAEQRAKAEKEAQQQANRSNMGMIAMAMGKSPAEIAKYGKNVFGEGMDTKEQILRGRRAGLPTGPDPPGHSAYGYFT